MDNRVRGAIQIFVRFPFFQRTEALGRAIIRIEIWHANQQDYQFRFIGCPVEVETLESCVAAISVEHADTNPLLDLDLLVRDLVQIGCGRKDRPIIHLPCLLRNGGELTYYSYRDSPDFIIQSQPNHPPAFYFQNRELSTMSISGSPATFMTADSSASFTHSVGYSPISNYVSPASFMSGDSPASFSSARSTYASPAYRTEIRLSPVVRIETIREDEPLDPSMPAPLQRLRNDYYSHLHEQNLLQPLHTELNWSGKGQHVVYLPKDAIPLNVLSHLGASSTAKVEKVLCRRIALARKTMRCSHQWTVEDALREVYHLQNLRHSHIVQLVGSYLQGRNFSILMYPVADCHLGTFLEDTADSKGANLSVEDEASYQTRMGFLVESLGCLTSAIAYIHEETTKHMDIKPQNILVRSIAFERYRWRIYLADFGLSRSFASQGHSQTDGPISRTPRYCAPEVYYYERRGRAADIFSLGCVFIEMMSVVKGKHPHDFAEFRRGNGHDESFHANLERVLEWTDHIGGEPDSPYLLNHSIYRQLWLEPEEVSVLKNMVAYEPEARPTAHALQLRHIGEAAGFLLNSFEPHKCCSAAPEPYVAYQGTSSDDMGSGS
jgi:serine/threonine protein kinase